MVFESFASKPEGHWCAAFFENLLLAATSILVPVFLMLPLMPIITFVLRDPRYNAVISACAKCTQWQHATRLLQSFEEARTPAKLGAVSGLG